jgi:hypothetical protein
MKFWEELIAYFPGYDMDRTENDASNNSSIVLPRRCQAKIADFYRAVAGQR